MFNSADRTQTLKAASLDSTEQVDNVINHPTRQDCLKKQAETPPIEFASGLWCAVRKRHCEPRENLRELLNKFVQPHSFND